MDDAVPGSHRACCLEGLAVFHVSFDAIVGLVQTYFKDAADHDGSWVVSFSSSFLRLPRWRQPVYCFDHRVGEQGGEVAVHMVRNGRVHPLLSTSHPEKTEYCSSYYLFRDVAVSKDMFLKKMRHRINYSIQRLFNNDGGSNCMCNT
jgi:hypothetical protein